MKTIAVKLNDEQAEALQVAAARRGLTTSAALAHLLCEATAGFTDFAALDAAPHRKRGRQRETGAAAVETLDALLASGETLADLFERFD